MEVIPNSKSAKNYRAYLKSAKVKKHYAKSMNRDEESISVQLDYNNTNQSVKSPRLVESVAASPMNPQTTSVELTPDTSMPTAL